MTEVFGPITGGTLIFLVTILTNYLKLQFKELTSRQVQFLALAFAFVLVPFHVITTLMTGDVTTSLDIALMSFEALIYWVLGWLTAIGVYEVGFKSHTK